MIKVIRVIFGIIILLIIVVLVVYGTLSPCEILKKEIAMEVGKNEGPEAYVLLGGLVERGIDTLNTIQCLSGLYKVKTEGVDIGLNTLFNGEN